MDNDPTIKMPPRRQASPTDDTPIKLPPRMSGSLKSSENSRGDTSPTDSVPLQGLPESGQPALEYEYSWDQSAAHMPVASESSSPIPPVPPPPPPPPPTPPWPRRSTLLLTIFLLL